MTDYIEIDIELSGSREADQETVFALLAAFGFDGFMEEINRILAYTCINDFSSEEFETYLDDSGLRKKIKSYSSRTIPYQNWNKIWESDYSPVQISDKCHIRAPFHVPPEGKGYDIIISPKMSFGTAHHETTRMMLEAILLGEWERERVLDLGCGTGVLAILAEKMGAREVIALDNDQWAWENAQENIKLNECSITRVIHGDFSSLDGKPFDTVFANINLNTLLAEMRNLSNVLVSSGTAFLSGFYLDDLEMLSQSAAEQGLTLINKQTLHSWTVGVYRKGD